MSEAELKALKGLSSNEVQERLSRDGYNELPSAKGRGIWRIIFEVFHEPMFLLLVGCGSIYLLVGDLEEALMLLGFVLVIIGITVYQERKTERALEALRDLSSPRALVIRDGEQLRIPGREVVMGDIIMIREGDRIPADAALIWAMNLQADESLLTGESVPVHKTSLEDEKAMPPPEGRRAGGDGLPFIFSGSLVVQGQGVARVFSVSGNTEMGKIGKALQCIEEGDTPLQKETARIVKNIFIVAIVLCAIVVVAYGVSYHNWTKGFLSGLTLAMATLPEEFPVVLTIFLALGAWRMSKKNVLTRRVAAVETLGSATVLCVDKTGTLTENRMTVQKLAASGEIYDVLKNRKHELPEKFHELVEYAILASKKDPFDPMEKALQELGLKKLTHTEHLHDNWELKGEYPLSRELLSISHVWQEDHGGKGYLISAKGAAEAICDLCHLEESIRNTVLGTVNELASEGLRVLGVAKSRYQGKGLPQSQHDFDFEFIGLIGLADPVRQTVPAAIRECHDAGMRVVMITGDYAITARNIGEQIGLKTPNAVISGPELQEMGEDELRQKIKDTNVFARVAPEQKLLLVNALKANGEIVAMTGDGVNDAPALKSAHIGVAMGERGTDVAREAASLVLLKDDFLSIVEAVRMGRRIFDNLKKAMAYVLSVHIPIAGLSLLPLLFGWPILLFPVHVVFLELIIDPACSVVFESEPEERGIMKRAPRLPSAPLFSIRMVLICMLQGLFSLLMVALVYKAGLDSYKETESGVSEARTLAFITLIVSNLCMIMSNRSWRTGIIHSFFVPNRALLWVVGAALGFLAMVLYIPFLQKLFHLTPMHLGDLAITFSAGAASILWFEFIKFIARRRGWNLFG
ncbi:MAG: ATPase [Lentisphaerae bacterium GWF2_52_8]|nr:MAG: ATPase [Lentisphaerae bacterium GWF2_52_8]